MNKISIELDKNSTICILALIGSLTLLITIGLFGVAVGLVLLSIFAVFGIGYGPVRVYQVIEFDEVGFGAAAFFLVVCFILAGIAFWFTHLIQLL